MSDAVELLRHIVGPDVELREWTATSWTLDRSDDDGLTIFYRVKSSATADDGLVTGSFDLVGMRIEPKVSTVVSRSPLIRSTYRDTGNVHSVAVGPDGPPLYGEDFTLSSWTVKHSGAHRDRWSVTLAGRLGTPVPEPEVVERAPLGNFVAAW